MSDYWTTLQDAADAAKSATVEFRNAAYARDQDECIASLAIIARAFDQATRALELMRGHDRSVS